MKINDLEEKVKNKNVRQKSSQPELNSVILGWRDGQIQQRTGATRGHVKKVKNGGGGGDLEEAS